MLGKVTFTNKIVAKNLGLDEKEVGGVMGFYFKELEKELTECNHPYIFVKGLGTFGLYQTTIDRRLRIMISQLRGHIKSRGVKEYKRREEVIAGLTREIGEFFKIRRVIKQRYKTNKNLKDAKALDDNQG